MEVNLKGGSFFISLPQFLYDKLKESCKGNETISFDLAAYLLFLIHSRSYADKDIVKRSWVALNAALLRRLYDTIKYKCKKHLAFLEQIGLINKMPHIHNVAGMENSSTIYQICGYDEPASSEKSKSFSSGYGILEIKEKGLRRKLIKNHDERKVSANWTVPYLTKWLSNDCFKMDKAAAIEYVNQAYTDDEHWLKKDKRMHFIENFDMRKNDYSRDGRDDRLHHYYLSIPSDLRRFITYNKSRLVEVDVKNSQPLFLTKLLKIITEGYYKNLQGDTRLKKIIYQSIVGKINNEIGVLDIENMVNNITTILLNSMGLTDCQQVDDFNNLVGSGQIYEQVGSKLLTTGTIWKDGDLYYVELYDKITHKFRAHDFSTLRKCAKKVTINALYCNPRKYNQAVKEFREMFPVITKILDVLKLKEYSDLPILLQRMESKFILDTCCKKIAKKYPNMLLISRHDSLSTTEDNVSSLKDEFQTLLNGYFNFEVKLGQEYW